MASRHLKCCILRRDDVTYIVDYGYCTEQWRLIFFEILCADAPHRCIATVNAAYFVVLSCECPTLMVGVGTVERTTAVAA